jgi:hypothetical protein
MIPEQMQNHLQKDSRPNAATVVSQVPAPIATNTDALSIEGSHSNPKDTRGTAVGGTAAEVLRAAAVNQGPRDATGTAGA